MQGCELAEKELHEKKDVQNIEVDGGHVSMGEQHIVYYLKDEVLIPF